MIEKKLIAQLNKQINAELFSSYLYLAMASYAETNHLSGFAKWMNMKAAEENMHAMKIYQFIHNRSCRVILEEIKSPQQNWESLIILFQDLLQHEKNITVSIDDLMREANNCQDYATIGFLQWFVNEQLEEEKEVDDILQKLIIVGNNPASLFLIDRMLAEQANQSN